MSPANRRRFAALAACCVVLPAQAATITVTQQNRSFSVPTVSIAVGDTVHFLNQDDFAHQMYVVSPAFGFDSDEQDPGQGTDIRFTVPGTYTVHCHIHPRMALRVDVH